MSDETLALIFCILEALAWVILILWGLYMMIAPVIMACLGCLFHRKSKKLKNEPI